MRAFMMVLIAGMGVLLALPAAAQVQIKAAPSAPERELRVVPPPLRYETTKPPDHDWYPRGTQVEHDPAFIEPLSSTYENASGSGRMGLSGWTAPNQPLGGAVGNSREVNGWFALGFSITWGGPPAPPARKAVPH